MALFGRTQKKEEAKPAKDSAPESFLVHAENKAADVLRGPRITEKASDLGTKSAYVFDVAPEANKRMVADAVRRTYKVTPRMVRMVHVRSKTKRSARTGKVGSTPSGKKAYVYLKQGDTITLA